MSSSGIIHINTMLHDDAISAEYITKSIIQRNDVSIIDMIYIIRKNIMKVNEEKCSDDCIDKSRRTYNMLIIASNAIFDAYISRYLFDVTFKTTVYNPYAYPSHQSRPSAFKHYKDLVEESTIYHCIFPDVLINTICAYALEECDVGELIEVRDKHQKWYLSSIVEIDRDSGIIRAHYQGWDSKWDEYISIDSDRICFVIGTNTNGKSFKWGDFTKTRNI